MQLAGKVRPETDEMAEWHANGFDAVELFLTTHMLDDRGVSDIIDTCEQATIDIASVHTPHIALDDENISRYVEATDTIAAALDATLVIDLNPTSTRYTPSLFPPSQLDAPRWGHENDPGVGPYYMRVNHLQQGYPLVLDTAHLHMSSESYHAFIEASVHSYTADEIPVIHLADGTRVNDGLPFGDGTVDVKAIARILDRSGYDGTVVLETPGHAQHDALELVSDWINL